MLYTFLADAVLFIHFAYVAFVVVGLVMIYVGWLLGWNFVRHWWFRGIHLACMAIVLIEALFGIECPLTWIEDELRISGGGDAYRESFMQTWIHAFMFFDLSQLFFTTAYAVVFALIVLAVWVVPPQRRHP